MKILKWRLRCIKNLFEMLFWMIALRLGAKRDRTVIPEGFYCYSPDNKKNRAKKEVFTYYIIPCPYYKQISKRYNGCSYCGFITSDPIFGDQRKECEVYRY